MELTESQQRAPLRPSCRARHPEQPYLRCTLPAGHPGGHVAEGPRGEVYATWPQDPAHGGECLTCGGHVDHAGVFHAAVTP